MKPRHQAPPSNQEAVCERRLRKLLLGCAPEHTSLLADWSAQVQELVGLGPPIGYPSPTTPATRWSPLSLAVAD